MNVGILRFLGTNCEVDVGKAVEQMGGRSEYLWYDDLFDFNRFDALVVPGGFSYGDYLRCGALAAKARAIKSVSEAVKHGTPVLGICNGFQILCEAGLLPGALLRNANGRFVDRWVEMVTVKANSHFPTAAQFSLPVAHGEGRFVTTPDQLKSLYDRNQIWLKYTTGNNPNGSTDDIAGISNERGNVVALMPHPERAVKEWMGRVDGLEFFKVVCQ